MQRVIAVVFLVLLAGCGLFKKKGGPGDSGISGDAATSAADGGVGDGGALADQPIPDDVKLGRKMNAYVTCSNKFNNEIQRARGFYLHAIDPKKGPNGSEGQVDLQLVPDTKECFDGVDKAKPLEPRQPALEAAGDAFVNALKTLQPLVKEGHDYYSAGNNKDDKSAKGKKLHPQLMAAWTTFFDSSKALDVQLEAMEEQIQTKKIARLEKDPKAQLAFHHTETIYRAKKVVEVASAAKLPADLDLAKFTTVLDAYEKAQNSYRAYADANKAEIEKPFGLDGWIHKDTDAFFKTSKELLRRKRDKTKFTSGEIMLLGPDKKGNTVEGTPANVISKYNDLIESSNRLNW